MLTMRSTSRTRFAVPALLAIALALGACGGDGDEDAADDDVATLDADTDNSGDDQDDGDDDGGGGRGGRGEGPDPELQDAMLEYAECMRDQGIDMPDPSFTEDGGVMIGGGVMQSQDAEAGEGGPSLSDMEAMEEADEACSHIMEEVRASMPEPDPEQLAEMQDQALEFAECMREHGIDFPDPIFEEGGGRMSIGIGSPDSGEGGIDPNDEDFQEASEECGGEGGFGFAPAVRVGDDGDGDDEGDDE